MIVVAVILYATWVPKPIDPDDIPPIPYFDKLVHAVMMGGLVGALLFDIRRHRRDTVINLRLVLKIALVVAVFSVVDEFVQGILPIGRPSDPLDLVLTGLVFFSVPCWHLLLSTPSYLANNPGTNNTRLFNFGIS